MPRFFLTLSGLLLSALLVGALETGQADTASFPERLAEFQQHGEQRQQALASLGEDVQIRYAGYGRIRTISGDLDLLAPGLEDLEASGDDYLERLRVPLDLDSDERLIAPRHSSSPMGHSKVRFGQEIDGIPVTGAFLLIRFDQDGRATSITADLLRDAGLPRVPLLSEKAAARAAAAAVFPDEPTTATTRARLVYHPLADWTGTLAWEIVLASQVRAFVDAQSGEVIAVRSTVHHDHGKHRVVYSANGSQNLTAQLMISEGGSTGDFQAMSVYDNAGSVYDYFQSKFTYNSIDGNNATINSTTRVGTVPGLAFFDDEEDWFGYGPEGTDGDGNVWTAPGNSLDVVAHEMMHSVTVLHRAQLDAGDPETHALGESLSDMFAAAIDAHFNSGVRNESWWIANDVFNAFNPSVALRYMDDPAHGGDVDNYDNFAPGAGPHANAGIGNLAFYLLTQGGTHPRGATSVNVQGIGMAKAERIIWEAIAELTATADFADLRGESATRAQALYGASEKASVHQAFDAVKVPGGPNQPPLPPASLNAWSEMCHGFHSAAWPESHGATSYEVRASLSTDFSIAPVMASGSGTSASWFEIPHPDPMFLGVRACNAAGCSEFRTNFQQYTWFQGCM